MSIARWIIEPGRFEDAVRAAAGWLHAHGVRPGERVAVLGRTHPNLIALTHAALRAGILPVVVNPYLALPERAWILHDADPALTIEDPAALPLAGAGTGSGKAAGSRGADGAGPELAPLPLGRPMLYTSGTTGRPKGVAPAMLDATLAREWADDERDLWRPEPGALTLVCSPLHHSAGHRLATAALLAGAQVMLLERFDPAAVVRTLANERVTGAFLVPTHLRRIFALGDPPRPRAVTRILHAAEPCPPALKRRAKEWLPSGTLWEFYGSTEGQFTLISPEEWCERPGSVGRARRGRRLEIADPDPDGVGTVYVSAPPFARWEYWRDPERTAAALQGDAFTVGDLGRLDDDGYLWLVSRREDLIISGGVNVYPAEVERILCEHPAVEEAAVFGVADPAWGQRVCAAVVSRVEAGELGRWVRERLAGPPRPKDLLVVDALPRNDSGKIDRASLRARIGDPTPRA